MHMQLHKIRNTMHKQNEKFSKDEETIQKTNKQTKIIKLKNTMTEEFSRELQQ